MSVAIDPNVIYTRDDLVDLIGEPMLNSAVRAGLRAIGDRYLGVKVLEYVNKAHEKLIAYHEEKKRRKQNEETEMEASPERKQIHAIPGSGGASDFHRKMAQMC
jgi:hypothetical protein